MHTYFPNNIILQTSCRSVSNSCPNSSLLIENALQGGMTVNTEKKTSFFCGVFSGSPVYLEFSHITLFIFDGFYVKDWQPCLYAAEFPAPRVKPSFLQCPTLGYRRAAAGAHPALVANTHPAYYLATLRCILLTSHPSMLRRPCMPCKTNFFVLFSFLKCY